MTSHQPEDESKTGALSKTSIELLLINLINLIENVGKFASVPSVCEHLLRTLHIVILFLDDVQLNGMPLVIASSISYFPPSVHISVIELLCSVVIPLVYSKQCQESFAIDSIPSILTTVFQHVESAECHSWLIESLLSRKRELYKDLLMVIAYGPTEARLPAVCHLFHYWPDLCPSAFQSCDALKPKHYTWEPWRPVTCERTDCPNKAGKTFAMKMTTDAQISVRHGNKPPPFYVCLDCADALNRRDFDQLTDILLPSRQGRTDATGNLRVNYSNLGRFVVGPNGEPELALEGRYDDEDHKVLAIYGALLAGEKCRPTEKTNTDLLTRVTAGIFNWFLDTVYTTEATTFYPGQGTLKRHYELGDLIERVKSEYIMKWVQEVQRTHLEVILAVLLPHPVEVARVGSCWDTLCGKTAVVKHGLSRIGSLIPYDIMTFETWDYIIPYWLEAIRTEVKPDDYRELEIILNSLSASMEPCEADLLTFPPTLRLIYQLFRCLMGVKGCAGVAYSPHTGPDDSFRNIPTDEFSRVPADGASSSSTAAGDADYSAPVIPLSEDSFKGFQSHPPRDPVVLRNILECLTFLVRVGNVLQNVLNAAHRSAERPPQTAPSAPPLSQPPLGRSPRASGQASTGVTAAVSSLNVQASFVIYLIEHCLIPSMWNLLTVEHSHLASWVLPLLLQSLTVPGMPGVFLQLIEKECTDADWKVRFQAYEKIFCLLRQLDMAVLSGFFNGPASKTITFGRQPTTSAIGSAGSGVSSRAGRLAAKVGGFRGGHGALSGPTTATDGWVGGNRGTLAPLHPFILNAVAHVFCRLIGSLDDYNSVVAQRTAFHLSALDDNALMCCTHCLEHQFDTVAADRSLILQRMHQLSCALSNRQIFSWDFFIDRFGILSIEAQINEKSKPDIDSVSDLNNMNKRGDVFQQQFNRAVFAMAGSDCLPSIAGTRGNAAKSTKAADACERGKGQVLHSKTSEGGQRTSEDGEQPAVDSTDDRSRTQPAEQRRPRPSVIKLTGFFPGSSSGTDFMDSANKFLSSLQIKLDEEGSDRGTLHQWVRLLLRFMATVDIDGSFQGGKNRRGAAGDELKNKKSLSKVQRHLALLLGYSDQAFNIPPYKLRNSTVFHAFISHVADVLDRNPPMGSCILHQTLVVLQVCASPQRYANDWQAPNFTLRLLEPHIRHHWLNTLLIILYKYEYNSPTGLLSMNSSGSGSQKMSGDLLSIGGDYPPSQLNTGGIAGTEHSGPGYVGMGSGRSGGFSPGHVQQFGVTNPSLVPGGSSSQWGNVSPGGTRGIVEYLIKIVLNTLETQVHVCKEKTDEDLLESPTVFIPRLREASGVSAEDKINRDMEVRSPIQEADDEVVMPGITISQETVSEGSDSESDSSEALPIHNTDVLSSSLRESLLTTDKTRNFYLFPSRNKAQNVCENNKRRGQVQYTKKCKDQDLVSGLRLMSPVMKKKSNRVLNDTLGDSSLSDTKSVSPESQNILLLPKTQQNVAPGTVSTEEKAIIPPTILDTGDRRHPCQASSTGGPFTLTADITMFQAIILVLVNFEEHMSVFYPITSILDNLNKRKTLPFETLNVILENLALYLENLPRLTDEPKWNHFVSSGWAEIMSPFETFFRKLSQLHPLPNNFMATFRSMTCLLRAPTSSTFKQGVTDAYASILRLIIEQCHFQLSQLIEICSLCNRTFKERAKSQLTKVVVDSLLNAIKFRVCLPDENLLKSLQVKQAQKMAAQPVGSDGYHSDGGGLHGPGSIGHNTGVGGLGYVATGAVGACASSGGIGSSVGGVTNSVGGSGPSHPTTNAPSLHEDTIGAHLKSGIAQFVALELSRNSSVKDEELLMLLSPGLVVDENVPATDVQRKSTKLPNISTKPQPSGSLSGGSFRSVGGAVGAGGGGGSFNTQRQSSRGSTILGLGSLQAPRMMTSSVGQLGSECERGSKLEESSSTSASKVGVGEQSSPLVTPGVPKLNSGNTGHISLAVPSLVTRSPSIASVLATPGAGQQALMSIGHFALMPTLTHTTRIDAPILQYLPWLKSIPSAVQQGPRDFLQCVERVRTLTWLLLGATMHTALTRDATGLTCKPIPFIFVTSVADLVKFIISGFPEQKKQQSVAVMSSLYHAFLLCQVWTVYCEALGSLHSTTTPAYKAANATAMEFWIKIMPTIIHLLSISDDLVAINGHLLTVLEELRECRSVIVDKLISLWIPILTGKQRQMEGFSERFSCNGVRVQ
nr:unnamed protein product [Spirometra erinaceieuropaei]